MLKRESRKMNDSLDQNLRLIDSVVLVSLAGNRAIFGDDISRTDEIVLETQATPAQMRDNLAEILHQLLTPLYERFAFFRLPMLLVEQELEQMMRRRF